MERRDDERRVPGSDARDQVGLGRVVEDLRATGSPDADDPGVHGTPAEVDEASEESFPASDPPTFMSEGVPSGPAGHERRAGGDGDELELPRGDDVP